VLLEHTRLNQMGIPETFPKVSPVPFKCCLQFVHSVTDLSAVQVAVCFMTQEACIQSVLSRFILLYSVNAGCDYCADHMEHKHTVRVVHIVTTVP
jgi:hypothetical protein